MHLRDAFISGAGAIAGVPRALVLVHDLFDEIDGLSEPQLNLTQRGEVLKTLVRAR